jgi:hypothetical protein
LESLWADLAGKDARRAYQALWALVAAPERSLPFLREHLRPVRPVEAEEVARLVRGLDSDRFETREQAMAQWERLEERAEPALRKLLSGQPSLEVRRRAEQLLEKLGSSRRPRQDRALAVLERIGTPAAREILQTLAQGMPEARLTQEAKASLQRLARRPTSNP